jgi:hypothetical protein
MGYPKKNSLLGYEIKNKGFEIKILNNKSEIKLWDNNNKDEQWYKEKENKIKELLSRPEFKIDLKKICYKKNQKSNYFGFYIPLDKFKEPKDNPPTPENILHILEAINELMDYQIY